MTECIKQRKRSAYCVACVAAMATETTVREFREFIGKKRGPYTDHDMYRYLISKDYCLGIGVSFGKDGSKLDNGTEEITVNLRIKDFPAYVTIPSETRPDKTHVVYWDGECIRDPNPKYPSVRSIQDIAILTWLPIYKMLGKRDK